MNKTYSYKIPLKHDVIHSDEFNTIEECVDACKAKCEELGVDYNDDRVKLFFTEDFGESYVECTEEGEIAG